MWITLPRVTLGKVVHNMDLVKRYYNHWMERRFKFSLGENYHVYTRGVEKRLIFQEVKDYERFVSLLYLANSTAPVNVRDSKKIVDKFAVKRNDDTLVDISAWCLMPNHIHLLLYQKEEGGISKFLLKLLTAYTMYFNKKYNRVGPLFQSTFKAEHADNDNYLKYLFSYIHLNPLKNIDSAWKEKDKSNNEIFYRYLLEYKYSSFLDYISDSREIRTIINKQIFSVYFDQTKDFVDELFFWIRFQ